MDIGINVSLNLIEEDKQRECSEKNNQSDRHSDHNSIDSKKNKEKTVVKEFKE